MIQRKTATCTALLCVVQVCRYNVKNPHKNMWELKPEYRHYKKDEEAKKDDEDKDESSDDDGF